MTAFTVTPTDRAVGPSSDSFILTVTRALTGEKALPTSNGDNIVFVRGMVVSDVAFNSPSDDVNVGRVIAPLSFTDLEGLFDSGVVNNPNLVFQEIQLLNDTVIVTHTLGGLTIDDPAGVIENISIQQTKVFGENVGLLDAGLAYDWELDAEGYENLTDQISFTYQPATAFTDNAEFPDNIALYQNKTFGDDTGETDALALNYNMSVSGEVVFNTPADDMGFVYPVVQNDLAGATDAVNFDMQRTFERSIGLVEGALIFDRTMVFGDDSGLTDNITIGFIDLPDNAALQFDDLGGINDTISISLSKLFNESEALTDLFGIEQDKPFGDALGLSDVDFELYQGKLFSDDDGLTDPAPAITHVLGVQPPDDFAGATDTFVLVSQYFRTFGDQAAGADDFSLLFDNGANNVAIVQNDPAMSSDQVVVAATYNQAYNDPEGLTDSAVTYDRALAPVDLEAGTDAVSLLVSLVFGDSVGLSYSHSRVSTMFRTFGDDSGLKDVATLTSFGLTEIDMSNLTTKWALSVPREKWSFGDLEES